MRNPVCRAEEFAKHFDVISISWRRILDSSDVCTNGRTKPSLPCFSRQKERSYSFYRYDGFHRSIDSLSFVQVLLTRHDRSLILRLQIHFERHSSLKSFSNGSVEQKNTKAAELEQWLTLEKQHSTNIGSRRKLTHCPLSNSPLEHKERRQEHLAFIYAHDLVDLNNIASARQIATEGTICQRFTIRSFP